MAYYTQQQPFYNPRIPFTGSIQGGLREGKSITVSGRALPRADRFHVNLQCGSRPDAIIALHFNPRYDSSSGYIVTNTKQNNCWGPEERIYQDRVPLGNPFNLLILVTSYDYKISVNGIHVIDYKHRVPFNMVDTIVVDGMVEVNSISFQDAVGIVPAQAGFQPQFAYPPGCAMPAFPAPASYCVPYKSIISGGLYPGKNITIQGVVNHQASRFAINLRYRSGIAFHYNPRFNENLVVRNTLTNEQWGTEERSGGMPFQKGQNFQLIISCNPYHYNVFVNGNQVHTYNHRFTRLNEIDVLEVSGDLSLTSISVNGIHVIDYKHRIPFNMVDTIVVDGMVEVNSISFQDAVLPSFAAQASYGVPYKTTISGGLWPGKNISIQGVVNPQASRFEINLRHKSGIAFHYNPRFGENVVVRNTKTMEQWGSEERSGDMPFHRGQNFQLIISCNPHHYNVFVNSKQVHTYNHRFTNLWEIDVLEVSGDLSLTDVNV